MRPDEAHKTQALLGVLDCHELTGSTGRRAGALKQKWSKKGRRSPDMIVAAIALEHGCTVDDGPSQ